MPVVRLPSKKLTGLSFSLPELDLARCWSRSCSLRMEIKLDHGAASEEFEEILALHVNDSSLCPWIMWRDADAVFVQSAFGHIQRYYSVAEAFEDLETGQPVVLTDIQATSWPT
jgi:hypothetical protein